MWLWIWQNHPPWKACSFTGKIRLKTPIFCRKLILDLPYNFQNVVPNKLFLLWWNYSNRSKAADSLCIQPLLSPQSQDGFKKLILGCCGSCCLMVVGSCVFAHALSILGPLCTQHWNGPQPSPCRLQAITFMSWFLVNVL